MVIGEDLEVLGREDIEDGRKTAQVTTSAADAEQARAGASDFVKHPEITNGNVGHGVLSPVWHGISYESAASALIRILPRPWGA